MATIRSHSIYRFAFYFLALSIPLSETGKQAGIIILVLSGIVYLFSGAEFSHRYKWDTTNLGLLFFCISLVCSLAAAVQYYDKIATPYDLNKELRALYATLRLALVFFVVRYTHLNGLNVKKVATVFFLAYAFALIWGEYTMVTGAKTYLEIKGIGHVNHSAFFSGIVSLSALCLYLSAQGTEKIFFGIISASSFAAVVQSGSRATLLAYVITTTIFLFRSQIRKKYVLYFWFIVLCFVGLYSTYSPYVLTKLRYGFSDPARLFIWKITLLEWMEHNIIFGIGPNGCEYIIPGKYGTVLGEEWTSLGHSHNTFLTILLAQGVVGLGAYLAFMGSIFVYLYRNMKQSVVIQIAFCTALLHLINSLANTTFSSSNALTLMIIWALSFQAKAAAGSSS